MKKQLILLTGLLALATSAFAAETTPALTLKSLAKEIQEKADEALKLAKAKTKDELLNEEKAWINIHLAFQVATDKVEEAIEAAKFKIRQYNLLINLVSKLRNGESFASIVAEQNKKGAGFTDRSPVYKVFNLINNAYQTLQNAIAEHGNVISTIMPSKKTVEEQQAKAQHFLIYVIDLLKNKANDLIEINKKQSKTSPKTQTKTTSGTSFGGSTKSTRAAKAVLGN